MSLEGLVAIVTGGGKGIGKAISISLAKGGADIVVAARTAEDVKQTASEIEALGKRALGLSIDITSEAQIGEMVKKTMGTFGRIDILVNNAGIISDGMVEDMTLAAWQTAIDTNLTGPFLCCREVLGIMKRQGCGKIITISSMSGRRGLPNSSAYCASKYGLTGLMDSLAKEVGKDNITVTTIFPGLVDTGMAASVDFKHRKPELHSPESWCKPEDIAEAVLMAANMPHRTSIMDISVVPTRQRGVDI